MFGVDFDYLTIKKKTTFHKNLFFPYNPNNYSIYLTDDIDNESRYFLNKWKIRN